MHELDFTRHNLAVDLEEVKRMFQEDFNGGCRHLVRLAFKEIMKMEVTDYLQAERYERGNGRRGRRNGYRARSLVTSVGRIDLKIPRDRASGYCPGIFERYKRVHEVVDGGIKEMFLRGVSTRKVGQVLNALSGSEVSAGYVSGVTKELDWEVRRFENEPVEDGYALLFLDALSVKIRYELRAKRQMVLIAYGIRRDGARRLISFRIANSESTGTWRSFLENLKVRGLLGRNLLLVVMDGAKGLWAAAEEVYPLVRHQLCWVHKLRNIARYGPRSQCEACVGEAARIMYAPTSRKAGQLFRRWKERWQGINPKAVECLERDFDRLIAFFELDSSLHRLIRTTNVIERSFKEVRRRLKVMGYFQDGGSARRIILSQFYYFNGKWDKRSEHIEAVPEYLKKAA